MPTGNVIDIKKEVAARVEIEAEGLVDPAAIEETLSSKFVTSCAKAGEFGDGTLYATLLNGQYIYNNAAGEWLRWSGHHWSFDYMNGAIGAVEIVARQYVKEISGINEQIAAAAGSEDETKERRLKALRRIFNDRIKRLHTSSGRKNTLEIARTLESPMALKGDELDTSPWLFPCVNGVINLKNGICQAGRQEDYLFKASPVEWKGLDTPAPVWGKFLLQVFDNNKDLVAYAHRLFGYSITGLVNEHVLPVFHGQGRNGKGTIVEILKFILGDLAGPIAAEMLLDQGRSKSAAGPSPDIMKLKGLRIAFASETDEGRKFSSAQAKWLTGGDTLTGRNPHDKYLTDFEPTHKLFLLTNHKPHASSSDFAFWERLHLVPFSLSFVKREPKAENERKADGGLLEELKKEASGILAWLVRGCLEWQASGLKPPAIIKEATAKYQREEDLLADFIDECCIVSPELSIQSSKLYAAFKEWFEANVYKNAPSLNKIGPQLKKKFRAEKSGVVIYHGVALKTDRPEVFKY